jgi:hypothetical protein
MHLKRKSGAALLVALPLALLGAGLATPPAAAFADTATAPSTAAAIRVTDVEHVAPGVDYRRFTVTTAHGTSTGHEVVADLTNPRVSLDLLHPATVSQRQTVSTMMSDSGAIAGTNGDFFNISETHVGIAPTNSSVGPEIADRQPLKANVPDAQRFGPGLPPGTSTQDVFGVGVDHRARLSTLHLSGTARTMKGTINLTGYNQYALPDNGVGLYTSDWGTVSRARATCGSDTNRADPCSTDTFEVVIDHDRVVDEHAQPGSGAIAAGSEVLLGRDAGADKLRTLAIGDHVKVNDTMTNGTVPPFQFALGGFPISRNGAPLAQLDPVAIAPRTAAGTDASGRTVYLAVVDGRGDSVGLSVSELSDMMLTLGATDAVNLDGGGSSELATRTSGSATVTVRNVPSDGTERAVANGIGVFSKH